VDLFTPYVEPVPATAKSGPQLRHYQTDVLNRGRAHVGRGLRRGVIQGETGCGKTYVEAELCRAANAKGSRVLVLADRRRLIKQIGGTLDRFNVPYGVLMAGQTHGVNNNVLLASRDTLAAWMRRGGFELPPADVILIDEGHKSLGSTYQVILERYAASTTICFTATPARGDGKSLGSFYQWIECTVPASQLIQEGWLVQPEVYAPLELAKQRKVGTKTKGLSGDPVSHWRRHADGLPTIAFSASVAESIGLRNRFIEAGVPAEHIDADSDDDTREAAFSRLQSGATQVLCSVKLLIEGVDIPEVSAAILWAPFGSLVEYRQACGRIMRPAPGKTRAVVLDHAGAAGVHGRPGDDVLWSLDHETTIQQRQNQLKNPKTVYCKSCGTAFSATPSCPACGWTMPRKERQKANIEPVYAATNEVLSRYEGAAAADDIGRARGKYWRSCLAMAVARGQSLGAAAAMFSRKFGTPPWSAGVRPLPERGTDWKRPTAEVFPQYARETAVAQ
jgi:DNA repair protein RadD